MYDPMIIYPIPKSAEPAAYLLEKYAKKCPSPDTPRTRVAFIAGSEPYEHYRIRTDDGAITVYGSCPTAFNAAVGYLLRNAFRGIEDTEVTPGSEFRSVYFANHFFNYYHAAPIGELCDYLEQLALWGQSVLCLWFDMHHFESLESPDAQAMIGRMNALFKKARELGMKTSLTRLANEYYSLSPDRLKARQELENGYHVKPIGFFHTELCMSDPEGEKTVLESLDRMLDCFSDVGLDYIVLWPYDQGGCTCGRCAPWGSNGFIRVARKSAELARKRFPDIRIILSCWRFDIFTSGEWDGLMPMLGDGFFADTLMVDINAYIPDELFDKGIPVLSFPEISMHGAIPWGGFGANPMPSMIESLYDRYSRRIFGGSLYSEGCYEDINKAVAIGLMYEPKRKARDIVREYCAYYFGDGTADELCDIVMRLEKTLVRTSYDSDGNPRDYPFTKPSEPYRYIISDPSDVASLKARLDDIEKRLDAETVASWRYRVLRARVVGDAELVRCGGAPNDTTDEIYGELVKLYHAWDAYYFVSPITRESIMTNRGEGV